MSVEFLLHDFDRVAEAPDAVRRLRKFILQLAVRGRLVPQSPVDRPSPTPPRVGPYNLPPSWYWASVSQIGSARLGKMLDRVKNRGKPHRYLRNVNVRWFDFDLSDLKVMPFEDDELEEFALRAGDVLICEGGEPGRAAVWDARDTDIYFQKALHRVRLHDDMVPSFFVYYLRAAADAGWLSSHATGATFQHLTGQSLASLAVPVPPTPEQHLIVSKVDELMMLCNRLEAAQKEREACSDTLRRASLQRFTVDQDQKDVRFFLTQTRRLITKPEHVTAVRHSIFELALTGRLVRTLDSDGDADELVAAASAANRQLNGQRRKPQARSSPPTVVGYELPILPDSWRWVRLDEIADIVGGVTKDDKNQGFPGLIEVPYLRVANVQRGYLDLAKVTTIKVSPEIASYLQLMPGDILFNEGGDRDKLGRGWIWEGQLELCIHQNHVFRARLYAPIVDPKIVSWHGNTFGQNWFIKGGKQTTNLASVSKTTLRAFPVPIPPLAQQQRILIKVEELMAVCDELEAALASAQIGRAQLLEARLRQVLDERAEHLVNTSAVAGAAY